MAVYCGLRELRNKEHFHPVFEQIYLVSFVTEMGGENNDSHNDSTKAASKKKHYCPIM